MGNDYYATNESMVHSDGASLLPVRSSDTIRSRTSTSRDTAYP